MVILLPKPEKTILLCLLGLCSYHDESVFIQTASSRKSITVKVRKSRMVLEKVTEVLRIIVRAEMSYRGKRFGNT